MSQNIITDMIKFTTSDGVTFDVYLKGNRVVLIGNSGTGKSFFANQLQMFSENPDSIPALSALKDKVIVINRKNYKTFSLLSLLSSSKGKLFVLDDGDYYLNNELAAVIVRNKKSQFIIVSRMFLPWNISPNYYGKFIVKDKRVQLSYISNNTGWD